MREIGLLSSWTDWVQAICALITTGLVVWLFFRDKQRDKEVDAICRMADTMASALEISHMEARNKIRPNMSIESGLSRSGNRILFTLKNSGMHAHNLSTNLNQCVNLSISGPNRSTPIFKTNEHIRFEGERLQEGPYSIELEFRFGDEVGNKYRQLYTGSDLKNSINPPEYIGS